jgi:hypothetical protein
LPEVERARQTLESTLGRRIVTVDDRDSYVCRPHTPGELASREVAAFVQLVVVDEVVVRPF